MQSIALELQPENRLLFLNNINLLVYSLTSIIHAKCIQSIIYFSQFKTTILSSNIYQYFYHQICKSNYSREFLIPSNSIFFFNNNSESEPRSPQDKSRGAPPAIGFKTDYRTPPAIGFKPEFLSPPEVEAQSSHNTYTGSQPGHSSQPQYDNQVYPVLNTHETKASVLPYGTPENTRYQTQPLPNQRGSKSLPNSPVKKHLIGQRQESRDPGHTGPLGYQDHGMEHTYSIPNNDSAAAIGLDRKSSDKKTRYHKGNMYMEVADDPAQVEKETVL